MELTMSMGAFEELDQKEMCGVDGGGVLSDWKGYFYSASAGCAMYGQWLPAILAFELGKLCDTLDQRAAIAKK